MPAQVVIDRIVTRVGQLLLGLVPRMPGLAAAVAEDHRRRCGIAADIGDQAQAIANSADSLIKAKRVTQQRLADQVRLATGDGEDEGGSVVMRCENPCRDSRAPKNLRLNNAQQQARFAGDTGLSRIERMTGVPQLWMSVRYQRGG